MEPYLILGSLGATRCNHVPCAVVKFSAEALCMVAGIEDRHARPFDVALEG